MFGTFERLRRATKIGRAKFGQFLREAGNFLGLEEMIRLKMARKSLILLGILNVQNTQKIFEKKLARVMLSDRVNVRSPISVMSDKVRVDGQKSPLTSGAVIVRYASPENESDCRVEKW